MLFLLSKSALQRAISGATSVEPAPTSEPLASDAVAFAVRPGATLTITAASVRPSNLVRVKGVSFPAGLRGRL